MLSLLQELAVIFALARGRTAHMMDSLFSHIGPVIGLCILAVLYFFLAFPLLLGLLMACKVLRYRDWLAAVAVALSMAIVAESGNYLYNLIYWTSSRLSPGMNVLTCVLTFGTPLFLFVLILLRSRRRVLWGVSMLLVTGLALVAMRNQFVERKASDAEAYRQGVKPLSPRTGTPLVRWWRDDRRRVPRFLLQGHVLEGSPVVLLTDPFARAFQPQFCTAVASTYWPSVKDPAELGNVTEMVGLKGCAERWGQGLAVLERPVRAYRAISFQPFSGAADHEVLTRPTVRQKFAKLGYDPANFDPAKAEVSQATALPQTRLFLTALQPIKRAPNIYPCTGPILLLSVHDLGNVQTVLPYCTLNWNLFAVDDDLYFAAISQEPTPPGDELPMGPDQTYWLFRVEGTELKQLWPPS
jgi:hypothetical protein